MDPAVYAALPDPLLVRELRFEIRQAGFRTRQETLVTTLIDPDVLRCKTEAGVRKEIYMLAIVYNLMRLVMLEAARRQGVQTDRISFADALRW